MKYMKKYKFIFALLIITIAFFTARLTITWDSAHYLSYVEIFEKIKPFSSWDIVRGPVFPLFIFFGNLLFGKNAIGILTSIFIVYLLYCYTIYLISKTIFKKTKNQKIYSLIFITFSIMNPLIFGYFHTLLTEFLVITLMIVSCFLSWKWIYITDYKPKILYLLFYVISLPFSYFLKQPYLCVIFIPLLLSIAISVIRKNNLKDICYRLITMLISCLSLIICIIIWNKILIAKNVDMNTGRDSSSLLTEQLLMSISNLELSTIDNFDNIKDDQSLTENERAYAKKVLEKNNKVLLIKIIDNNKLIESDLIGMNGSETSVIDVLKEISFISVKHPNLLIEAYSKNYCALSSICIIDTNDGIGYWITNRLEFVHLFENNAIAYRFLSEDSNLFYLSPEKYESAKVYEQVGGLSITSRIISLFKIPTNIIYKLVMIFTPIISLMMVITRIIKKNKIKNYDMYTLGMMFLMSSLLTTIACSIVGQIIDRYSVYCFIPGLIGIITCSFVIIENTCFKKDKR